jgi:HlyD family secretion protein
MKKALNIFVSLKEWWGKLSRRTRIIFFAVLVLVIIIVLKSGGNSDGSVVETVKRQTLDRTVLASGKVVSSTDLSLSFEQSKVVQSISVKVGDKVKKGQTLATLSNGTERAALLAAKAKYNKVLEGSSNEEIALARVNLESITKTQDGLVEDARRKLLSSDLVARADSITEEDSPVISGIYTGQEGSYTVVFHGGGSNSYVTFTGIESGTANINSYTPNTLGTKGLHIQMPLSANPNEGATWTVSIPNTSGVSYVANLNAYQSAKNARDQAIAIAQAELNLKLASARRSDVDAALADVISAESNLEKTILRAPAEGTITKVDIKYGEISTVGKVAISLQDISNLYLEANINENNIRDVELGQSIEVTFDAFGDDKYSATVSSIDPASTTTNNVVNYKIKALISDTDDIKPGMTANMTILTKEIENALVLPGRTIETKNGKSVVHVITDERRQKTVLKDITIGLRGDGDLVEITSGLNEGDKVLWTPPATK